MIKEFRGKTKWLSNFSPVKIVIDGIEYLILTTKEQIKLDTVLTFNGRRHKEEE